MRRFGKLCVAGLIWAGLATTAAADEPQTFADAGLAWVRGPKIGDMARFYPTRAKTMGVRRGLAAVDCTARADGKLDCTVAREDPTETYFGDAALKVMKPVTVKAVDGGSPAGKAFRFTLKFGYWPPSTLPDYTQLDRFGLRWTKMPPVMKYWAGTGLPKGDTFSVELDCVADAEGVPACEITEAEDASPGYAKAVLKAMADARVKAVDGGSPAGKTFTHRITMSID